jgi:hypothetical protein
MRILAGTRTLRSSPPSLAGDRFWVPGCSPGFGDDPEGYTDARTRKNCEDRRVPPQVLI